MAQWLSVVCGLQYMFLVTAMTLDSKVKVKYTYNQFYGLLCELLIHLLFMVCRLQRKLQITALTLESMVTPVCF